MASDPIGSIVKIGLIGGAAYFAWNWWTSQQTSTTPATPATPPVPAPAPASSGAKTSTGVTIPPPAGITVAPASWSLQTTPNVLGALVGQALPNSYFVQQGGQLDAYQWDTLWNALNFPPLDIGSIFFPQGMPQQPPNTAGYSAQGLPLMSPADFLKQVAPYVQSSGLTINWGTPVGVSGLGQVAAVPVAMMLGGRRRVVHLPPGSTPAQLQMWLRGRANGVL